MERKFKINPAFDKRHPDPKKNCGIHGCDMVLWVEGDKGAVVFVVFTNWHLPEVQKDVSIEKFPFTYFQAPMGADLGYHSKKRTEEYQSEMEKCEFIGGANCFYEGSSLVAEEMLQLLYREGSEGVYKKLEEYYKEAF